MSDDPTPSEREDAANRELGPFRLLRKLGEGGMGVVYEAEDKRLRRRVALKVLPPELVGDAERRRRLLREARLASAAKHPNIAAVFEVGEADGMVYLAMELVHGETLRARCNQRGGPLGVKEALEIGLGVAEGLAKAHEAGVIHRDLKPENVMVGEGGAVKILDFGLSKSRALERRGDDAPAIAAADTETIEGRVLGTPAYMSPEQAKGRSVDARTDIFSFGVVLYEMITGARPFRGPSALEIIISIDRDEPRAASALNARVPTRMDRLLARCLAKRPEDRFANGAERAAALRGALGEVPGTHENGRGTSEERATGARATGEQATTKARRAVIAGALLASAVGVIAAAVIGSRSDPRNSTGPGASSDTQASANSGDPGGVIPSPGAASSPALSSASAPPRPLRHPCAERLKQAKDVAERCGPANIAWCDAAERVIACCGKGLVAVGHDGICGCPAAGCGTPASSANPDPQVIQTTVRAKFDEFRACYSAALEKSPERGGRVSLGFELTPDGDVFRARIHGTTFPDPEMQACALDVIRRLKFPPPPSGSATVVYPLMFSPGGG